MNKENKEKLSKITKKNSNWLVKELTKLVHRLNFFYNKIASSPPYILNTTEVEGEYERLGITDIEEFAITYTHAKSIELWFNNNKTLKREFFIVVRSHLKKKQQEKEKELSVRLKKR